MSAHEYDILEDKHTLIGSGVVRFYLTKDSYIEITQEGDQVNIRGMNKRGADSLVINPVVANSISVKV